MSELLKKLKRRSKCRRRMIARLLGFSDVQQLRQALNFPARKRAHKCKKRVRPNRSKRGKADEHVHSSPFGVHNDYSQHFVDTGQRPQNFIREGTRSDRFQEHPRQKELVRLKDELLEQTAIPPMFLKCDLSTFDLNSLNIKFDVLLVIPPLEEYQQKLGVTNTIYWNWEQVIELNLSQISAERSFIFLWCGSSDGVDKGRDCLRRWGFRRCEDICWVKTNCKTVVKSTAANPNALFQHTKEHCLMGIKGTVHRSTHSDFIHTNIDTDIIISEEKELGSLEKPDEIFNIIEHFCLGKRRLHLFGLDSTIRPGWLTLGHELTSSNFNMELYKEYFNNGQLTTGCTYRIEKLRPKSPTNNMI